MYLKCFGISNVILKNRQTDTYENGLRNDMYLNPRTQRIVKQYYCKIKCYLQKC